MVEVGTKEGLPDFSGAMTTVVVSDIHLADAEPPHPKNPLWKRYKRPSHFIDRTFADFLKWIEDQSPGQKIELILNGDIFDFDSVMMFPSDGRFKVSWLERKRGLYAEEAKSRFKMNVIMRDHHVWRTSMRDFIKRGHRAVFIIGNHDLELHWPGVQRDVLDALELEGPERSQVRFCEWFYVSNRDTLIEHGNQYDAYTVCPNPINPLISKVGHITVRSPFGNLAGKFMMNGMGLMNPHSADSFIKDTMAEYMVYFYRYIMRTQPFILFTWFWSAGVTLIIAVSEALLPALSDPLTIEKRVKDIAARGNSSPEVARTLRELHVHPAVFRPLKLLQELWLDRAMLLLLIFILAWQIFSVLTVFGGASSLWFFIPLAAFLSGFLFYSRRISSSLEETQKLAFERSPLSARVAGVTRVVHGHTHLEKHALIKGVEYLNTGTWSPAYRDPECTQPYGAKCFAWIRPQPGSETREARLFEWKGIKEAEPARLLEKEKSDLGHDEEVHLLFS